MHEGIYTGPLTTHSPSSSLFFPIGAQVQHRHGDVIKHGHWTWYHLTVPKVLLPGNLGMHACVHWVCIDVHVCTQNLFPKRRGEEHASTKLGLEVYKCFNLSGWRLHGHVNVTSVDACNIPTFEGKLVENTKTFVDCSLVPPTDVTPPNFAEKLSQK